MASDTPSNQASSSKSGFDKKVHSKFPIVPVSLVTIALIIVAGLIFYFAGAPARYRSSIEPTFSFTLPNSEAPDYELAKSWAIYPDNKPEGAWETPWGVDVFFIHGTTSDTADFWNIPVDDLGSQVKLQSEMLPNYARPFQAIAPVYAPQYRQATLHAIYNKNSNSNKALNQAYLDVEKSFDTYMKDRNQGRAIIVAGIGQGGLIARRLLSERFSTDIMKRRLVAAYLIESPTPASFVKDTSNFPACDTDEQTGCIASWNTILENDQDRTNKILSRSLSWTSEGNVVQPNSPALTCFNPSINNTSGEMIAESLHRGSVNASNLSPDMEPVIIEGAVSSQCVNGFLVVSAASHSDLKSKNSEASRMFAPAYNLFYSDIVFDAAKRARITSAWLDKHGARPAPPLPPMERIEIAPINKIEKILGTN